MKKLYLLLLLPIFAISAYAPKAGHPLKIGAIIPKANVKMQNYAGAVVSLRQAGRENGLLVMFSSNTCATVIQNHLRILDIANYALDNKVGVIILNSNEGNREGSDSQKAMKTYAEVQGYNWLYVLDKNSEIADAFGATRNPESFLFNRFGKLVYHGSIDDSPHDEKQANKGYLRNAIKQTVAGKSVTVKETESVGCAIKRK